MGNKSDYYDESMVISRTVNGIESWGLYDYWPGYLDGEVLTPAGIVVAFSDREAPISILHFVHQGRLYTRTIHRAYTSRGLARKARVQTTAAAFDKLMDTDDTFDPTMIREVVVVPRENTEEE